MTQERRGVLMSQSATKGLDRQPSLARAQRQAEPQYAVVKAAVRDMDDLQPKEMSKRSKQIGPTPLQAMAANRKMGKGGRARRPGDISPPPRLRSSTSWFTRSAGRETVPRKHSPLEAQIHAPVPTFDSHTVDTTRDLWQQPNKVIAISKKSKVDQHNRCT